MYYQKHSTAIITFLGAAIYLTLAALPVRAVSITLHHSGAAASEPVGTPIFWTATNAAGTGTLQFRWVISQNGTTLVFRDFNTTSTISYAPLNEGSYTVTVTARNAANFGDTDTVSDTYTATSLLKPGGKPNVKGYANNPLIAIYTATCTSGSNIRVFFARASTPLTSGFATPLKACTTGKSVNFIIAGMRASTTYNLAYQIQSGFTFSFGPTLPFTTGSIPSSVPVPTVHITGTLTTQQPVILQSPLGAQPFPIAFDTSGHVIWYNHPPAPGGLSGVLRVVNGGNMLMATGDVAQEFDLLGNILRETNTTRMTEQLSGPPFQIINHSIPNRLASFDHDMVRLPNGFTGVISTIEQIADQGQGPVDVLGNVLLVLDRDYQLVWAWDAFKHLNVKRKATLPSDTCASSQPGCPPLELLPHGQTLANDWMHGNSLTFTGDGNLLFSIRNQDWVIKIHYGNATGTANGEVLWRVGNQGDFSLLGGGVWFSHQHDASLRGTNLALFDNANGTHSMFGNSSRGLVIKLDEQAKTAEITDEALMGSYSFALGTAQILLNGNLWFLSGFPNGFSNPASHAIEFAAGAMASPVARFDTDKSNYRMFRMKDLYTP